MMLIKVPSHLLELCMANYLKWKSSNEITGTVSNTLNTDANNSMSICLLLNVFLESHLLPRCHTYRVSRND